MTPHEAGRTRREKQKAETRTQILESARRLFAEKGYRQATIRDVAGEAGVALGTIFTHFPDKEALLSAALIDELDRDFQRSWETIPVETGIREQMLHLAVEGYRSWLNRSNRDRELLRKICFTQGPARDELKFIDRGAVEQMQRLLDAARLRGEIRSDTDTEIAARTAFSMYLVNILYWLDDYEGDGKAGEHDAAGDKRMEAIVEDTRRFIGLLFRGMGHDTDR
ncbi:TetR family transcriptional regulator [bacterium]|nr:TetR family transcriptional regulator [bacterium]